MAKLNLPDIGSLANNESARQAINDNFTAIEAAIENTLSRDGDVPNQMDADLDINGHKVLNVGDPTADADAVNYRSVRGLVETFMGEIAQDQLEGTARAETFVATSGQTNFPLIDSPGFVENMYVFDNGVALIPGVDFTLTGSDLKTLTFFVGRTLGHTILVRYTQLAPTDGLLRSDLASPSTNKGSHLVIDKQDITGTVSRTQKQKNLEILSVKDFGAVGDGVTDDTAAFNTVWQRINDTFVDNVSEDYVSRYVLIPPGVYRTTSSINWTNLKARNVHIIGWGAVIKGSGAANNVIDMIGSRWVQVHGLTVFGDEANPPKCGILIGPERSAGVDVANGNNYFHGVNVTGYFVKTAFWNIGSETTTYVRSRFANRNTDPAAYVFIGDGAMQFGATSAYMTLRPAATQVSFTNNKFYACDLRNLGGGNAVAIEATSNWGFDSGCYFMSLNAANIQVYLRGVGSHSGLSIEGLFENAQTDNPTPGNTGCKYTVEFVTNGLSQAITGFNFRAGIPHYANACIKITGGSLLALRNADISVNRGFASIPFFDAATLTISGRLTTATPTEMNLNGIAEFNGYLYTRNFATQPLPPTGAYVLVSEDDAVVYQKGLDVRLLAGGVGTDVEIGNELDTRVSILGQSTFPRIRAIGAATDIDLQLEGKGAGLVRFGTATGNADAPIIGYISIKDSSGNIRKLAYIA